MSTATRSTWLTALAVLLTSASLVPVFEDYGWLLPVVGAVGAVALAGLLSRRLRLPALVQPVLGVLAVGMFGALLAASQTLVWGLLPGRDTVIALGTRIGEGLLDVEQMSPPVPSTPGLVLLTVLGVGGLAVLADLLAVALRRPALTGLPLLALLLVPAGTLDGGVGVVPFTLGAVGWLALLMADNGERVGRWGTALRSTAPARGATRSDDTSLGRVGRRIGVAAVGAALIVPALVPGLESSLVDGVGGGLGGSRTTTTYNPLTRLDDQLRLPEPQDLLRYSTTDPTPDYLRLTTLDLFDDQTGWSASKLEAGDRDAVERGVPTPSGTGQADTQPLTAQIQVQGLDGPWLPLPPVPTEVDVEGRWLWDADAQTVFSTRTDLQRLDEPYTVSAARVVPSVDRLRRGGPVPAEVEELAQPPQVSPYVRELTRSVVAGADTPYDQALALQSFFRDGQNGFEYSLDTSVPGVDTPNALQRFLEGKRGFCEQYASAMAAMARVLGLPARVAVGFLPGTRLPDGTYQVTTDDAHAWPEIWFAGHGWLRFEPTPRTDEVITPGYTVPAPPEAEPGAEPVTPTQAPLPVPDPADPGASGDNARQLDELAGFGGEDQDAGAGAGLLRALAVVLALAVLLSVPAAVAALRRRRRWAQPGADAAWAQVQEDAGDVGHTARPSESPRAYAGRLAADRGLTGAAAQALQRIATAVERARYARPGGTDAGSADALHADVVAVRGALHAGATPRTRWVARLAPPSTLRWIVTTSGTAVADLLDRVDAVVSGIGARARRLASRRTRSA